MTPSPSRWDEATREAARQLDDRSCLVIAGARGDDAARAALSLAKTQVGKRRVAIVDAVGELAPLQRMLPRDVGPHGVIDHFLHGVSLRKIAHAVNREGTLFIVPSGAGPFEYDTLLRRERWRRLTMAFRGEGALLLIVLPADAAGLSQFVEDTDGVLLVGDVDYSEPRHVLSRIGATTDRTTVTRDVTAAAQTTRQAPRIIRDLRAKPALVAAIAAAGVVVAIGLWMGLRDRGTAEQPSGGAIVASTSPADEQNGEARRVVADSANASAYSIDVVMLNSLAEAGRQLTERLGAVPAATFSPVMLGADSARWYRLVVGAWRDASQADSALLALRAQRVLQMGFGSVRRTPFAVRVGRDMTVGEAMSRAIALRAEGLPAYVLQRDENHARVYAGAFESPSHAVPLLDMFKREGIEASIDYRIGRGI